jgi:hypothetical protein
MAERQALDRKLLEIGDGEGLTRIYNEVFNTDSGKLVLQDLKNRAYFYTELYSGDIHQSLINEGMRLMVVSIETRLLPMEQKEKENENG